MGYHLDVEDDDIFQDPCKISFNRSNLVTAPVPRLEHATNTSNTPFFLPCFAPTQQPSAEHPVVSSSRPLHNFDFNLPSTSYSTHQDVSNTSRSSFPLQPLASTSAMDVSDPLSPLPIDEGTINPSHALHNLDFAPLGAPHSTRQYTSNAVNAGLPRSSSVLFKPTAADQILSQQSSSHDPVDLSNQPLHDFSPNLVPTPQILKAPRANKQHADQDKIWMTAILEKVINNPSGVAVKFSKDPALKSLYRKMKNWRNSFDDNDMAANGPRYQGKKRKIEDLERVPINETSTASKSTVLGPLAIDDADIKQTEIPDTSQPSLPVVAEDDPLGDKKKLLYADSVHDFEFVSQGVYLVCPKCSGDYDELWDWSRHLTRECGIECVVCATTFDQLSDLLDHRLTSRQHLDKVSALQTEIALGS